MTQEILNGRMCKIKKNIIGCFKKLRGEERRGEERRGEESRVEDRRGE
jgi:hypothetical protein